MLDRKVRVSGKRADLTGMKFGRVTVIRFVGYYVYPNGNRERQWLCKCECGNEKIFVTGRLKRGIGISCGCKSSNKNMYGKGYKYETIEDSYDCIYEQLGLHKHTLYADDLGSICGVRL